MIGDYFKGTLFLTLGYTGGSLEGTPGVIFMVTLEVHRGRMGSTLERLGQFRGTIGTFRMYSGETCEASICHFRVLWDNFRLL